MSRILLATFGSLGDLHPYIAVGKALCVRGHDARIATSPEYQSVVESAGLEFAPVRPRLDVLGSPAEVARRLFHPLRGPKRLLCEFVMPFLRHAQADLTAAAADADLLVSHPLTFTVPIVARLSAKPWLSSVLAPLSFTSRHDPPTMAVLDVLRIAHRLGPGSYDFVFGIAARAVRRWEAPLHELRRELGLPPTPQIMTFAGQFSPLGTVALFDAPLAAPQRDWPAHTVVCGAPVYDGVAAEPAQLAELRDFLSEGDAPLVFALGSSAVWMAGDYWRHAIAAVERLQRRALLLTGPAVLPRLPQQIRAFAYLPYSQVFPHAAVIVHQAGIGTLSLALRSGRPQLLTPVAFDQPDNAVRAARLGVGRVLPFRRVTAARLHEALRCVLGDPRHAAAAGAVAAELRQVDGAGTAAAAIINHLPPGSFKGSP